MIHQIDDNSFRYRLKQYVDLDQFYQTSDHNFFLHKENAEEWIIDNNLEDKTILKYDKDELIEKDYMRNELHM